MLKKGLGSFKSLSKVRNVKNVNKNNLILKDIIDDKMTISNKQEETVHKNKSDVK